MPACGESRWIRRATFASVEAGQTPTLMVSSANRIACMVPGTASCAGRGSYSAKTIVHTDLSLPERMRSCFRIRVSKQPVLCVKGSDNAQRNIECPTTVECIKTPARRRFPTFLDPPTAIGFNFSLQTWSLRGCPAKLAGTSSPGFVFSTAHRRMPLTCRFTNCMRLLHLMELTIARIPRTSALCATTALSSSGRANTFSCLSLIVIFFLVTCLSSLDGRRDEDFFVFSAAGGGGPHGSPTAMSILFPRLLYLKMNALRTHLR